MSAPVATAVAGGGAARDAHVANMASTSDTRTTTNLAPMANPNAGTTVQKLIRQGHQIELLHQAKQLCDAQDYVDLTIYCEDGVVRAHQMLLATASPFLKLLFQSSPLYGVDEISLILPEVKACLVQALIHFVYTGTVVSKEDHFYSLMKLVYALNINASIEAESTNEKPTSFGPALTLDPALLGKRKYPLQQQVVVQHPQQVVVSQHLATASPMAPTSVMSHVLPTQPVVSLPTHPVPPAKMPRMMTPQTAPSQPPKMAIQLPTHPVPLSGMVNGGVIKQEQVAVASSYIAHDPTTGLSYKVEMPNGPSGSGDNNDPLAAIMNETIFTDPNGATIYAGENGTLVYATSQAPIQTTSQLTTVVPTVAGTPVTAVKGKKRKVGSKENAILAESVDDLPCTPDDEDINTPYPCEHCSKTIKGKVMLQAHIYQEHYDNPNLANLELGDKHACRVCLKLFTRNSDVKAHILRVHCGDRRYPCTMCGKRFKESTHLRKHLYTHTGERPHFCSLCNKGFQTSSDLKRHKRTKVHQERVEQGGGAAAVGETSMDDSKDDEGDESQERAAAAAAAAATAPATTTQQYQWTGGEASGIAQQTVVQAQPAQAVVTVAPGVTTSNASGTTVDMKALGSSSWNNNSNGTPVTASGASTLPVPAAAAAAATPSSTSNSSTLDLKAITSAEVWQQQPQQRPQVPQAQPPQPEAQQPPSQAQPQPIVAKRSSSADSPSQDEERLTVVEGDESSQDSVHQVQQQPPPQSQPQQPQPQPPTTPATATAPASASAS